MCVGGETEGIKIGSLQEITHNLLRDVFGKCI